MPQDYNMGDELWDPDPLYGDDPLPPEPFPAYDPTEGYELSPGGGDYAPPADYNFEDPSEEGGGNKYLDILKKMGLGIFGDDKSSVRSDLLRGGALDILGAILAAKFAQPNFQERRPFTGGADPQALQEEGMGGLRELGGMLKARPQLDFSGITAKNPMGGMADDEITQLVKGVQ